MMNLLEWNLVHNRKYKFKGYSAFSVFVDIDKVKAIESFIESEEDICILLVKINDYFISMDGHTGLYYVMTKGYYKIRTYFIEPEDYLWRFVEEERKINVYSLIN